MALVRIFPSFDGKTQVSVPSRDTHSHLHRANLTVLTKLSGLLGNLTSAWFAAAVFWRALNV